ncbi:MULTISPECIES: hypothetical protein [Kordiimonas]|mgnify:CR=1 FL=1|jgi:hypothetical protein|uniref:hypothetical protein n=1 Tax=Kordiimonas TaxID=288021 RepID=UPI00258014A9|nr:hypothetical protein [Kordiimonas sp. UBA4487]
MQLSSLLGDRFTKSRLAIIILLAGLLVFYHISTVYDLYLGDGMADHPLMIHIQSALRLSIAASLMLVVIGVRRALYAMWLTIGGLVLTQYIVHFGSNPPEFALERSAFSYLRGFIFPTIITLLFPYRKSPKS